MAGQLAGRLALITGGGSGIGRAVCELFAKEGAKVAAIDINEAGVKETINKLEGEHRAYTANIGVASEVANVVASIKDQFSQVPCIAVNAAGITRDKLLFKMDEKAFDQVINVNLKGTFLIMQAVSKMIAENKVQNGAIVNISSIAGKCGNVGQTNYTASKAGVIGMTKTAAKELAQFGIRCNVILPGFIETPMTDAVPDKILNVVKQLIPMARMGQPEELAQACLFLASTQSSYVTGTSLEVTGGIMM